LIYFVLLYLFFKVPFQRRKFWASDVVCIGRENTIHDFDGAVEHIWNYRQGIELNIRMDLIRSYVPSGTVGASSFGCSLVVMFAVCSFRAGPALSKAAFVGA
jgi:hypothetical protein